MEFAVMQWNSKDAKGGSIFGMLDKAQPGKLPIIVPGGHWADFRSVDETRCPFADAAKASIAERGYYLAGASVTVTEAFGNPPA